MPPKARPGRPTGRVLDVSANFEAKAIGSALAKLWALNEMHASPILKSSCENHHCPITLEPVADPVMLGDGSIFEHEAILHWLRNNDRAPCTNVALQHKDVIRLAPLRDVLECWWLASASVDQKAMVDLEQAMVFAQRLHESSAVSREAVKTLEASILQSTTVMEERRARLVHADCVLSKLRAKVETRAVLQIQAAARSRLAQRRAQSKKCNKKLELSPPQRSQSAVASGASRRFVFDGRRLKICFYSTVLTLMLQVEHLCHTMTRRKASSFCCISTSLTNWMVEASYRGFGDLATIVPLAFAVIIVHMFIVIPAFTVLPFRRLPAWFRVYVADALFSLAAMFVPICTSRSYGKHFCPYGVVDGFLLGCVIYNLWRWLSIDPEEVNDIHVALMLRDFWRGEWIGQFLKTVTIVLTVGEVYMGLSWLSLRFFQCCFFLAHVLLNNR